MKHSDAILVYGKRGKKELGKFINADKIFIAQNTIDTEFHNRLKREFDTIGKESLKKNYV